MNVPQLQNAATWAVNPVGAYKALEALVVAMAPKVTARQRGLTDLRRQVEAIGLYAKKLNNPRLQQVYLRERMNVENLRTEANALAAQIHGAASQLLTIKSKIIQAAPRLEPYFGVAPLIPVAQAAALVVVSGAIIFAVQKIDAWVSRHDGSVKNVREALQSIAGMEKRGEVRPEEAKRLRDYVIEHGGLPTPPDLPTKALMGLGTMAAVVAIVVFVLPMVLRRGRAA